MKFTRFALATSLLVVTVLAGCRKYADDPTPDVTCTVAKATYKDPAGNTERIEETRFDGPNGRVSSYTASGVTTQFSYDASGQVTRILEIFGPRDTVGYFYEWEGGRVTRVAKRDGSTVSQKIIDDYRYTYAANGELRATAILDTLANLKDSLVISEYRAGRPSLVQRFIRRTDIGNRFDIQLTRFTYDANGNMTFYGESEVNSAMIDTMYTATFAADLIPAPKAANLVNFNPELDPLGNYGQNRHLPDTERFWSRLDCDGTVLAGGTKVVSVSRNVVTDRNRRGQPTKVNRILGPDCGFNGQTATTEILYDCR